MATRTWKVVLEVGELGTYDNVRRASILAIAAARTSPSRRQRQAAQAATLPVTLVMLEAHQDAPRRDRAQDRHEPTTRQAEQAVQYLRAALRDAPCR